jgi:hypothetical protein
MDEYYYSMLQTQNAENDMITLTSSKLGIYENFVKYNIMILKLLWQLCSEIVLLRSMQLLNKTPSSSC